MIKPDAWLVTDSEGWRWLASTREDAEHTANMRGGDMQIRPLYAGPAEALESCPTCGTPEVPQLGMRRIRDEMLRRVRAALAGPLRDPMKLAVETCTRQGVGHAPCNGWARADCVTLRCAHGCWPGRSACMCKASVGQECCFSSSSSLASAERAFAVVHLQRDPLPTLMELTEGPLQPEERVPWHGYAYGWPDGRPRPYPTSKELRAGVPTCDGKNGTCKCWDCVHGLP